MSCDVGKAAEGLENELWRRWSDVRVLQSLHRFTYVTANSPTSPGEPPVPLWWCLIYPWWFCNLQWLRPAGLYERCKMVLELKRLKIPAVGYMIDFQIWKNRERKREKERERERERVCGYVCACVCVCGREGNRECVCVPMMMFKIWWFCNLQWLRPAGLYERCKLALELKRLKTPALAGLP